MFKRQKNKQDYNMNQPGVPVLSCSGPKDQQNKAGIKNIDNSIMKT